MQIFIRNIQPKTITLDVESTDSVQIVKEKIYERTSVPPQYISLAFQGKVLHSSRPLHEYDVRNDDTLHVLFRRFAENRDSR